MNTNTALEFIGAINEHNVTKIANLMASDHKFIDSQGGEFQGKETMVESWKGYFALFPDYRIDIEDVTEKGSLVCLFGYASATFTNGVTNESHSWRIPAAWKANIEDDLIKLWQVYADNSVVISIVKGE
jgi:ketosteroid isomerase-like protein